MDRFKNILLAASPGHLGPMALDTAIDLARTNGARLTVLDVVGPASRVRKKAGIESRAAEDAGAALEPRAREERLRDLLLDAHAGSDTEVVVKVGEPVLEVIRHVIQRDHDLVMVGSTQASEPETRGVGEGAIRLLRQCPVPVWAVRPSLAEELRILALVDPDPADPVRNGLNDLVLELAMSLTLRTSAELHVGHAWALERESTLRSSPFVALSRENVDAMVDSAKTSHQSQLDALVNRHRVTEVGAAVHMVTGDPRKLLPRLASHLDIGLIVMGTVARTGLSGRIMGNTAESILRSVTCSVMAVKPSGFVTPVKLKRSGWRGRSRADRR